MLLTTTSLFLAAAVQMAGNSADTGAEAPARVSNIPPATADSVEYDGSSLELGIAAVHAEDPEIRVDGRLDEAAWARAPGRPRQTGQVCELGDWPYSVEQPQKILVLVVSWTCTSRPMTVS